MNTISELRSIRDSADELNLPYSTLAKWYYTHKEEFPEVICLAISGNSGRAPRLSHQGDPERRARGREDLPRHGLDRTREFVDAVFRKVQRLQADNERIFGENQNLRRLIRQLEEELSRERSRDDGNHAEALMESSSLARLEAIIDVPVAGTE